MALSMKSFTSMRDCVVQQPDRELFIDELGKNWGHSSRVKIFSGALAAVFVVGAFAGLMALVADNGVPQLSEPPARIPARVSYTFHSPISIDGNADFTAVNGVSGGDGSISDPYIISDWDINASSADGIQIWDADVHFIVRNCYIHDGMSPSWLYTNYGLFLWNCTNGAIENNTFYNNYEGIIITESHNIKVSNNNCSSNNAAGIAVDGSLSRDNALYNNTCTLNQGEGIFINFASNNTVVNNTCVSNLYNGMYLQSANNNTLVDNTCTMSNSCGIYVYQSFGNTLANNNLSSNYFGMEVEKSGSNTIVNNTCNFGNDGLALLDSANNTLVNNTYVMNSNTGIYIRMGGNNTIADNACTNEYYGIYIVSSNNNRFVNNMCTYNRLHGIYLENSNRNSLADNNCSLNMDIGIYLVSSSDNNTLTNNTCSKNEYGIELVSSADNIICNNTCILNGNTATDLWYSHNNTVSDNNFSLSGSNGLYLFDSSNNSITRNQLQYNVGFGVYVITSRCSDNRIWNNTFIGNNGASGAYDPSHVQASDDGTNNWWNSTEGYGNYWSDWTTPDVVPPFGIVDQPYVITGGTGASDFYPQTTPPTLALVSPNGGEQWQVGMTYQIRWTWPGMVSSVAIQLYRSGALDYTIASSTANTGTYDWVIPESQDVGTEYKIRIGSSDGVGVSDQSDGDFSITGTVTLTSPNGGERWVAGTVSSITWTSTGGSLGNLKIDLYEGGSLLSTLAQSTTNDGSFDWSIPTNQTVASDYRIKIESTAYAGIADESDDDFAIGGNITVTSPNGGEEWAIGSSCYVNWTFTGEGLGTVKIELFNGSSPSLVIAASAVNNGSYLWSIPDTLTVGSNYRIKITSLADSNTYDESDSFSIVEKHSEDHATTMWDSVVIVGIIVAAIVLVFLALLLVKRRKQTPKQIESEKENPPPTPPDS